jgi:hypothetical protein
VSRARAKELLGIHPVVTALSFRIVGGLFGSVFAVRQTTMDIGYAARELTSGHTRFGP